MVASWAVYFPLLRRLPPALPPMVMPTVITGCGLLILLPFHAVRTVFIRAGNFPVMRAGGGAGTGTGDIH